MKSFHPFAILVSTVLACLAGYAEAESLIENANLEPGNSRNKAPGGFELTGDCVYGNLSSVHEIAGFGVRFMSSIDVNRDKESAGELSTVSKISPNAGRWYRLQICGMAQQEFAVDKEDLYLRVEFAKDDGKTTLDHIKKSFFVQVEEERRDLKDKGTNKNLGAATWRTYALDFRTPFPEVDTLRLSVGFGHGAGKSRTAEFWINQFELIPIPAPESYIERETPKTLPVVAQSLVPLGGRWYFDPQGGTKTVPKQFDHKNADQLLYLSAGFIAPFAQNTTSWLRKGYLGADGKPVRKDKYIEDNVVITVTNQHLVMRSRNLPNHPTAVFPDSMRSLDGNPNYIAERQTTWYLPLEPQEDRNHVAMQNNSNTNKALPRGPIGVAVNGIVFFNPFDHLQNEDAVWRLDRCCGHPAPNALYHYHKYPVCVKSPWTDDGQEHSPVIGFAFDGFPVYGPYEAAHELARDSTQNPLNEFNGHYDEVRGWHYHVTPGKFPHIIGGYWGVTDEKNRPQRGPQQGPPGPGGPPPFGRPPR